MMSDIFCGSCSSWAKLATAIKGLLLHAQGISICSVPGVADAVAATDIAQLRMISVVNFNLFCVLMRIARAGRTVRVSMEYLLYQKAKRQLDEG